MIVLKSLKCGFIKWQIEIEIIINKVWPSESHPGATKHASLRNMVLILSNTIVHVTCWKGAYFFVG